MGFTPFPNDISVDAIRFSFDKISSDADMISYHFDNGVPWNEALNDEPFSKTFKEDIRNMLFLKPKGHQVYLSLTPINLMRTGLAPYHGDKDNQPLAAPWDHYKFNSPEVKTAYLNYVLRMIRSFNPNYLNFAIEANLLKANAPELWDDFLELDRYVYRAVKNSYPKLPVFASITVLDLMPATSDKDILGQRAAWDDLSPQSDYLAISIYPYMNKTFGHYPEAIWGEIKALSHRKPIAVAETGFTSKDVVLQAGFTIPSSERMQADYIKDLLDHASLDQYVFVSHYLVRDYDALADRIGRTDLIRIWEHAGLYDKDGKPKPALSTWKGQLSRSIKRRSGG
jgi:hypothetical protein